MSMKSLQRLLEERGHNVQNKRYLKPAHSVLRQLQAKGAPPMSVYRFRSLVYGRLPMFLEEAINFARWLDVDVTELIDEDE